MSDKYARMTEVWLCMFLILLAVVSRLLPHPPNFTPLAAVGLFAGAYLGARIFWLVPVTALLVSDMVIGFYPPVRSGYLLYPVQPGRLADRTELSADAGWFA